MFADIDAMEFAEAANQMVEALVPGELQRARDHMVSTIKGEVPQIKVHAPDGTFLLVEPMAGETVAENNHPVGRVFYAASTLICTPAGQSQGSWALGAQVPESRWSEVLGDAGFTGFRRAAETPFNRIFEVRP